MATSFRLLRPVGSRNEHDAIDSNEMIMFDVDNCVLVRVP